MNDTGWTALVAAIAALFGAFLTGLFAWMSQKGKNDSDHEIALIGQWKELTAALSARVAVLEAQVEELTKQNDFLKRTIAQNSQSSANLIGDIKKDGGGGE